MESFSCLNSDVLELLKEHDLLNSLVRRELRLLKSKGIEINNEEIENMKNEIFKLQNIKNEEEFEEWAIKLNTTPQDFIKECIKSRKIEKYYTNNYSHLAESLFLKNKESYDTVIYRLIRVQDRDLANEIYLQLKEKEINFGQAASSYSIGPEKNTNGVVGPIPLSSAHQILKDLLKTASKNVVNQPIKIMNFWLIVQLESLQEAVFDSNMKLKLAKEVFNKSISKEANIIVNKLLQQT